MSRSGLLHRHKTILAPLLGVCFLISAHTQVVTLEDELEGTAPQPPTAPTPSPAPPETLDTRTNVDLELIPPVPSSPEEPFPTDGGYQPDIVAESEDAIIFGNLPGDPQYEAEPLPVPEVEDAATESKWFFADWLGNLLSLGSSGDPDSRDRFRLSLNLNGGYDSNVLASSIDPVGSAFSSLTGGVAYFIGSQRFEFSLRSSGGVTVYQQRPGGRTDYNGQLAMEGFYRFTRRLTVNGSVEIAYLSQPDPETFGGVTSFQGDYIVTNAAFGIAYSVLPTLVIRPAYRLNTIHYQDELVNQQSGFNSQTFSLSLEWLVRPATTLTTEYRYNPVTYNLEGEGSEGHILTAGFIQAFSPKTNWTLQGGAEYRLLQNPFQQSTTTYLGPFVESALAYQFAPASELTGRLRYGTEPSGQGGVTIRRTLRTTLGVTHSFSGRLSIDLGIGYENSFYDQPDVIPDYTQETYFGYVNARYRISNAFSLNLGYSYTAFYTDYGFGEYTRGVTTFGFQFSF